MEDQQLTAILIDDEKSAIATLRKHLANHKNIKVKNAFTKPAIGVQEVFSEKPDILFVDVDMPIMNGFDVAREVQTMKKAPKIVFITSYEKFAIQAIKHAAFDFILKPVNPEELAETIAKIQLSITTENGNNNQDFEALLKRIENRGKLKFNTSTGFIILDEEDIIYLEAQRNYCDIHMTHDRMETLTMNMNKVGEMLPESHFFRISRFHIINTNYLQSLERRSHSCILKAGNEDQIELKVSKRNTKLLEDFFTNP